MVVIVFVCQSFTDRLNFTNHFFSAVEWEAGIEFLQLLMTWTLSLLFCLIIWICLSCFFWVLSWKNIGCWKLFFVCVCLQLIRIIRYRWYFIWANIWYDLFSWASNSWVFFFFNYLFFFLWWYATNWKASLQRELFLQTFFFLSLHTFTIIFNVFKIRMVGLGPSLGVWQLKAHD